MSYKKGSIPWNKGLSKKDDPRLAKISEDLIKNGTWNKGKNKFDDPRLMKMSIRNLGHIPWNKGLTKYESESLRMMGESRKGDNNPMSWKNHPDREDEIRRQSATLKMKIRNGEFTPKSNNRLIHSFLEYDGIKFRSSWEVVFYYQNLDKKLEYETVRVPYTLNGIEHTYLADFYDPKTNTIYEVKPDRIMYIQKGDKYDAIKRFCIEKGYNFVHIGDEWHNSVKMSDISDIPEKISKLFDKGYKKKCALKVSEQ